jgi:hypothetical protein
VTFDRKRNFDCGCGVVRRAMRHRQDGDECRAVGLALDGERYDTRAILAAFVLASPRFMVS